MSVSLSSFRVYVEDKYNSLEGQRKALLSKTKVSGSPDDLSAMRKNKDQLEILSDIRAKLSEVV